MNLFHCTPSLKISLLFLLFFQLQAPIIAQLDTLTFDSTQSKITKGYFNINFSNVGLSNWAGGGQDALSLGGEFDYNIQVAKKRRIHDLSLNAVYGVTKVEGFRTFRKTDDQLNVRSLYGRQIAKRSYITFLSEFWTQLTNGFEFDDSGAEEIRRLVSQPLAPGYLNTNLGYTIRKQDHYALTLSPFTGKLTMVLDDSLSTAGAFGVRAGKRTRFEGGAGFSGNYTTELMSNVVFKVALTLFSNYNKPEAIDVNLRSSLKMKVNEIISSGFSIALIYDEDVDVLRDDGSVGPAWQFRNVINVGVYLKI